MSPPGTTPAGWQAGWVTNEAGLLALGPAWEALADRAEVAGHTSSLYDSHGYVSRAWRHLRAEGDQLAIVTLSDGPVLRAVWPLVRSRRRVLGAWPLQVLQPIGIWEGERPGMLCDVEADAAWPGLWSALCRQPRDWHGLDLRELDAGAWLLTRPATSPAWLHLAETVDTQTPWQPFDGTWEDHLSRRAPAVRAAYEQSAATLRQRAPDLRVVITTDAAAVARGLQRYLALDALQDGAGTGAPTAPGYLLGRDAARTAFYRDWLPALAARDQAQIWLLETGGRDVAALLRLRTGEVWLERHLTQHPAWQEAAPALHLIVQALARSWCAATAESDLLVPPSALTRSLLGWYDAERPTRRLKAWNLRSQAVVMPMIDRLRGRA